MTGKLNHRRHYQQKNSNNNNSSFIITPKHHTSPPHALQTKLSSLLVESTSMRAPTSYTKITSAEVLVVAHTCLSSSTALDSGRPAFAAAARSTSGSFTNFSSQK